MVSRAAIIIAGGQGSRLGGIDKPQLSINGLSMRARVAGAAIAALGLPCRIVVVGAEGSDLRAAPFTIDGVETIRTLEEPRFSGPVAGLAAAVDELSDLGGEADVLVLGGDMPTLSAELLQHVLGEGADGSAPADSTAVRGIEDSSGHLQFLCAAWPLGVLRTTLNEVRGNGGDWMGLSLRRLYGQLAPARLTIRPALDGVDDAVSDVDTAEDLQRARIAVERTTP